MCKHIFNSNYIDFNILFPKKENVEESTSKYENHKDKNLLYIQEVLPNFYSLLNKYKIGQDFLDIQLLIMKTL